MNHLKFLINNIQFIDLSCRKYDSDNIVKFPPFNENSKFYDLSNFKENF